MLNQTLYCFYQIISIDLVRIRQRVHQRGGIDSCISGVALTSSLASGVAPRSSNRLTTAACPFSAAKKRGVFTPNICGAIASTGTPASSNSRTRLNLPVIAAGKISSTAVNDRWPLAGLPQDVQNLALSTRLLPQCEHFSIPAYCIAGQQLLTPH